MIFRMDPITMTALSFSALLSIFFHNGAEQEAAKEAAKQEQIVHVQSVKTPDTGYVKDGVYNLNSK